MAGYEYHGAYLWDMHISNVIMDLPVQGQPHVATSGAKTPSLSSFLAGLVVLSPTP